MDEEKKVFKCDYCEKDFASASYRLKHTKRIHGKTAKGKDLQKTPFLCESCGKDFKYKSSLERHMNSVHSSDNTLLCDRCTYTTVRKDQLNQHIQHAHSARNSNRVKNFRCAHCPSEFTYKYNLRFHERTKHNIQRFAKPKNSRKCPLCAFFSTSSRKKEINDHFRNKHNLMMEWQKLEFPNRNEFCGWKKELEIKDNVSFVKRKFSSSHVLHYFCHRSGKFTSFATNKRRLKLTGSCKINAHCPCEIVAKPKEDGQLTVYYLPTHVGHKNELKHLRPRVKKHRFSAFKSQNAVDQNRYAVPKYDRTYSSMENEILIPEISLDSDNNLEKKKEEIMKWAKFFAEREWTDEQYKYLMSELNSILQQVTAMSTSEQPLQVVDTPSMGDSVQVEEEITINSNYTSLLKTFTEED